MAVKVALLPCNGIGRVGASLARQSAYRIAAERPDETVLVSSSALITDQPDALSPVRQFPTLIIEGCRERCASYLITHKGSRHAPENIVLYIPQIVAEKRLQIDAYSRREIRTATDIIRIISQEGIAQVDRLVSRGRLHETYASNAAALFPSYQEIQRKMDMLLEGQAPDRLSERLAGQLEELGAAFHDLFERCREMCVPPSFAQPHELFLDIIACRRQALEALQVGNLDKHAAFSEQARTEEAIYLSLMRARRAKTPAGGDHP